MYRHAKHLRQNGENREMGTDMKLLAQIEFGPVLPVYMWLSVGHEVHCSSAGSASWSYAYDAVVGKRVAQRWSITILLMEAIAAHTTKSPKAFSTASNDVHLPAVANMCIRVPNILGHPGQYIIPSHDQPVQ